jgi:HK97 family phage prohead protease
VADDDLERANQPAGGQFALGGGRVSASGKKPAPKKAAGHAHAAPVHHGPLGFNGKTGAGYGVKGGDHRVRELQQALNRFGLTDDQGKPLALDGKYGPRTTAAVKKAQKALGLEQNGKVTEDFIKALAGAKSLRDVHAKPAAKPKAPHHQSPAHKPTHPKAAPKTRATTAAPRATGSKLVSYRSTTDIQKALASYGVEVNQETTARPRVPLLFDRSFALDDIQISRSGDGRTVEAYAAIFGSPYEVRDQHGHYMEVIDRSAFNRTLQGAGRSAVCVYNHGMTLQGTPDMLGSVPLGTPLEIKADGRGLLTVTRYNKSALADSVLEAIRNGDIRSQSFRGRIMRSNPNRVPRREPGMPPPTVTRHELGLSDYGPTPIPVNEGAAIMAVRSLTDLIEDFQQLDPLERDELLRALDADPSTPDEDPDDEDEVEDTEPATPDDSGPGAEDPSLARHSGRLAIARARLRAELIVKGLINA